MKNTKEKRPAIGRRIYEGNPTLAGGAETHDINYYTALDYLRMYKVSINASVPQKPDPKKQSQLISLKLLAKTYLKNY